jgi:hypothetical protein
MPDGLIVTSRRRHQLISSEGNKNGKKEDNILQNRRRPQKNSQHILPGNLTYTTTNSKFKQKNQPLNWDNLNKASNGCDIILKFCAAQLMFGLMELEYGY